MFQSNCCTQTFEQNFLIVNITSVKIVDKKTKYTRSVRCALDANPQAKQWVE